MSDAKEDEVDDRTGLQEEGAEPRPSLPCSTSVKRMGSKRSAAAPSFPMPSASPQRGGFDIPPLLRRPHLLLCYTEEEPLAWYGVREHAPGEFEGIAQCVG